MRIAIGQISSESNHFVTLPCELDMFRNTGYLLEGEEMFQLREAGTEVSGALAYFKDDPEFTVVPLLAARANSSGPLSQDCYGYLRNALLRRLREANPVDGVFLSFHGSMAAVDEDDPEGDVTATARAVVGPYVPIVITHDCHANVTERRVRAANAIVGYEHYPHDDVFQTGERGAAILGKAVRRKTRPVIGHAKLPMLLTGFNASSAWDTPFARLMQKAKLLEKEPGVISTSIFLVGSYIDVPDVGCNALVVTDGDAADAQRKALDLAEAFWEARKDFETKIWSVTEAVQEGRKIEGGPVLLLDTADTTGGGASGDGIGVVAGLLEAGVTEPCIAMVVDPEAAAACAKQGVGSQISLDLGHKLDPTWGKPIKITGKVTRVSDGRFRYTGGILGGTSATMGPSVVLQVGNIEILIQTFPTYDWADEQYRSMGLNPREAKFVGVKNMMNFRFGYRDIMKGFFVLNLPGPTPPDMRMLPFKRVKRPLFPLDDMMNCPEIHASTSQAI
jgi:microcystin degradation protein MlrC